eukprot:Sdes_comp19444_c0_seq2m10843
MQVIEPQSIVSPGDVFPREESSKEAGYIIAQIENENGVAAGPPVHLPENMDSKILATLLRQLLIVKKDNFSLSEEEEPLIDGASFSFFLNEEEIINSVGDVVKKQSLSREQTLTIIYRPDHRYTAASRQHIAFSSSPSQLGFVPGLVSLWILSCFWGDG